MNNENKRITNLDLAKLFIEKNEKSDIIPTLFDFFSFDCFVRCNTDPSDLDNLIRDFNDGGANNADTLSEIIGIMRKSSSASRQSEQELLNKIKLYITDNLIEEIAVEEIACKLNISYYYMCHFFKAKTGISVNTFRNEKRIEKSIRLLSETNDKISDIATACGFNNISYFTELFTKTVGASPSAFRNKNKGKVFHQFYGLDDMLLADRMKSVNFFDKPPVEISGDCVESYSVHEPDEQFGFLHEAAIIEYKGVLYASWYNCPKHELKGYTPICERRSFDGGKTWSKLKIVAHDPTGKILYCPPVYGICDDKLYMFMNQMVAPDHIHSLDLYVLNTETDEFELVWSRPIPFKINTNVVALPNGKLMLPGRIGKLDGFPNTPAVLISDSGKIDAEWRLVKIAENGDLPDGKKLVHPEITVSIENGTLYMFCRNDQRPVPLVYISRDCGESWSEAFGHDIPFVSKMYAGELSDKRHYLVANIDNHNRSKLVVYFTDGEELKYNKYVLLFDKETTEIPGAIACHYPACFECGGKLYIIATINIHEYFHRGAILFKVDLSKL